jgi:hypothetical protein
MKREISHAHEYILMRAKIPAGRERILLVDKIIYLVVEFAPQRDCDSYVLTQTQKMPSGCLKLAHDATFVHVNDEYSHSRNTHFRTLQKPFRTTTKLHLR